MNLFLLLKKLWWGQ